MLELYLSQNQNSHSDAYGKWYPRVSYKQTLNIHDMAVHMAEHNTPFSEGTIEGILRDFVKCTREQTLMGNTVKVDNLAIFKVSCIGNGCSKLYDADADKTISASIGTMKKTDKTGPAVNSLKLLAQATGEYTREELNKDGRLGWTDKAAAQIAEAKNAANGGSAPSGGSSDSGNGGSQSGNGGSEQGGNSGSQSGDQNQATSFALTITKSGSGTSTVKNDSEETINSGDSLESGANVYIAVTPAEGQIPTATLNGSNVSLTENDGEYVGTFQMPAQASTLVINSGSDAEEGDQN
ncbi:MAG: hypothetical protein K6F74_00995 [Prevotella sp.]|nr:hypothetical protein [Prevotella sp.]